MVIINPPERKLAKRTSVHCSTFKAPTPRNQNLKTAESHRVVLFRKSAGKLVKNGLKHD
jgi:hypothetical protein